MNLISTFTSIGLTLMVVDLNKKYTPESKQLSVLNILSHASFTLVYLHLSESIVFPGFNVNELVFIQGNTHESIHHFTEVSSQHLLVSHNVWLRQRYYVPAGKHQQKEPG